MSVARKSNHYKDLGFRVEMEEGKLRSQCYNYWIGKVRTSVLYG